MAGPSFEGTTRDAGPAGNADFEVAAAGSDEAWSPESSTQGAAQPQSYAPGSRDANGADDVAAEVARLETLLAERAHAAQEQKAQLQHAQRVLRAAALSFERTAASGPDPRQLTRQRDAAVARAIEAEAARAELSFRLDELLGYTTEASARPAADTTADTVRGLSSRLSQAVEAREVADARLVLAEQDLSILRGHVHTLERELVEAREQIEFEALRARGLAQQLEGALGAPQVAALRGELAGAGARRDEGEGVARALVAALEAARAGAQQSASQIQAIKQGLAQETETAREVADKLARALAEGVVLREQLAHARPDPHSDAEQKAAEHNAAESRGRADRMRDALREARHVLGELAGALERTVKTMPPVAKAPHEDAESSDQPTQPGMPTYIEAMEGLEELVALRDEHIRDLTTKLALERDRTRAVERGLQALEASTATGTLPEAQWSDLMTLVRGR